MPPRRKIKNVQLKLEGTETEIDRNVLQVISDSLIHLVRNCVGHGIEQPEARKVAGKPETGTVVLKASSDSSNVLIEIIDDGAGINVERVKSKAIAKGMINETEAAQLSERDLIMLIFEPGFSTMDSVTSISGRGVGMDVVKRALDSIGGTIDVNTMRDQGTRISLSLPSSMAVKSTLLFELNNETFAIPLSYTESVISIYKTAIQKAGNSLVTINQNRTIPVLFLTDLFESCQSSTGEHPMHRTFNTLHPEEKLDVVVVTLKGKLLGLVTHKLLQQKEIVEKPLRKPVDHVKIISGTTILGNGSVCMVLNIPVLVNTWMGIAGGKSKTIKSN
jgi:two-component system, chemotaxis family, sensor kinase CheA